VIIIFRIFVMVIAVPVERIIIAVGYIEHIVGDDVIAGRATGTVITIIRVHTHILSTGRTSSEPTVPSAQKIADARKEHSCTARGREGSRSTHAWAVTIAVGVGSIIRVVRRLGGI